jgi:hypothetical protein
MNWSDIVEAMDAEQPAKKRGPYKKTTEEISNWPATRVPATLTTRRLRAIASPLRRGGFVAFFVFARSLGRGDSRSQTVRTKR